jgi:YHS domain-containing protein
MMLAMFAVAAPATAQDEHQHPAPAAGAQESGHDMTAMAREGSGTSWLPDASPMYMRHLQKGPWMLMGHENAFVQFLSESGDRGDDQAGSINWVMGMAERMVGSGHLGLRGMFSLEPWTIRGCGYPDLLASGEQCRGETIHDRQHPHDLAMEMSAEYDAPLARDLRWQVYGGPSAEPALGPVAYPHRVSAMPNPVAPLTHHWLDSTHVSFGVVTGGVYAKRWKIETSAFNGREPDEHRKDFDFGALDSVSGRVWFLPTSKVALQMSGGHLSEAEAGDAGAAFALGASAPREPRRDVNRVTASATFHQMSADRVSASTFAWGRNSESGEATNALLIETNVTFRDREVWFGRLEVAQKTPHDLDVPPTKDTFTVSKIQGGYTHYISAMTGFKAGVGAAVSAGIVPGDLKAAYGGRVNPGFAIFLALRPAAMAMGPAAGGGARTMVMVQTAYDPAKLTCPAGFDPRGAARTVYEGKTYYFCSAADRDRFLTDPKMSLSMMPPKQ